MSWPADVTVDEAVLQALHAVDCQQTLDIKHRPWISEDSSALDAGWAIGPYPSDRRIYAYCGAEAVLHLAVTAALAHWAPAWVTRTWEVTTITLQGVTVAHNARIGLRLHF